MEWLVVYIGQKMISSVQKKIRVFMIKNNLSKKYNKVGPFYNISWTT